MVFHGFLKPPFLVVNIVETEEIVEPVEIVDIVEIVNIVEIVEPRDFGHYGVGADAVVFKIGVSTISHPIFAPS